LRSEFPIMGVVDEVLGSEAHSPPLLAFMMFF
jgi:hypothetical protein